MSKSEEVDVIVKPAEIFVVTDHPQTLSQKVTLYNLSKFKVLFQVHVSPSKRYMVSRKRGLLDAFCYVNIAVRYMPDNKDVNVRSTDKIFFEITACKDANYDSCQSKSYQTTLIHLLNSAIIFPNGLNKLSEDSSCPDSRTCHLEEPAQPLSCHAVSSIVRIISCVGLIILFAYVLSSAAQTAQFRLYNNKTKSSQYCNFTSTSVDIKDDTSSILAFALKAIPHTYQLFIAYCLGVATTLAVVSLQFV